MAAFRRHCACVGFIYITRAGKLCDTSKFGFIKYLAEVASDFPIVCRSDVEGDKTHHFNFFNDPKQI